MDRDEVRSWLAGRIAGYLRLPPDQVDPARPLDEYGLDSLYATVLCGEIEDTYGLLVEPTLLWDHPTVDALTLALLAERSPT